MAPTPAVATFFLAMLFAGALAEVATAGAAAPNNNRKLLQERERGREGSRRDRDDDRGTRRDRDVTRPTGRIQLEGDFDDIGSRLKGFWGLGQNQAATAMATAGSSGFGSATATAAARASVDAASSGAFDGLAETFVSSAASSVSGTAAVMAKAAAESRSRGDSDWQAFARSQARGFATARSRGTIDSYASAVAEAINKASDRDTVVQTYGVAFAQAIASGGAEKQGLVSAVATAFCEGGSMAAAFAEAFSAAITRNANGCLVLTEARATAVAQCNAGGAFASAKTTVTMQLLGRCNLRQRWVPATSSWSDDDDK